MGTRRDFLRGIAAVGAVSSLNAEVSRSEAQAGGALAPPSSHAKAMELEIPEGYSEADARHYFVHHPASDFMVDVIKSLDIPYLASNPGSSFRGLQESIINYGGNKAPEFLTCLHEESSVAIAHGYSKIAYKPMAVACHGTVGLQHAAMAIYNAWCDRAPVIIFAGNHLDAVQRRPGIEWAHAAQDAAKLVRDFTKWDDVPVSLPQFAESLARAYKIATTPPMGPVVIVLDAHLQEMELAAAPRIPALSPTIPPQGDQNSLREVARLLVNAERPVILVDQMARTPEGMQRLVELAELLQAPVVDLMGRLNFPNQHYLNHSARRSALIREADVILGLEVIDFWGNVMRIRDLVHRDEARVARTDVKLISIGVGDLYLKSNYQNFQRYLPVNLSIAGDGEATLPGLIEEIKRVLSPGRRSTLSARSQALQKSYRDMRAQLRREAAYAWNASPITTARLSMELWMVIKDRDWSLVSDTLFQSEWPQRLWIMDRHHHYIGGSGGAGVGYGAPAAVGAALANRDQGRLSVTIQADGDLMYAPGVLWTSAHHRVPLLSVMHNNRGYHQEIMHLQRMANWRQRGGDGRPKIGNVLEEPLINYATLAKSMGVWSSGPIENPTDLAPALKRALEVVDRGEPALVDVVCQPR